MIAGRIKPTGDHLLYASKKSLDRNSGTVQKARDKKTEAAMASVFFV